jgi:16S rRNA (guanine(966)-N(2))-methyltransferase RsmD
VPQYRSGPRSGTGTRPTTDRVRESLFNVLVARLDFDGLHVLDLYAGSGALGLEALSRGAASAVFVESDRRAADTIAANMTELGVAGTSASVRRGSVDAVLATAPSRPVDIVFADPPYEVPTSDIEAVVAALSAGWVTAGAVAVLERPAAAAPVRWPAGWTAWPQRRYGDTRVEFGEFDA